MVWGFGGFALFGADGVLGRNGLDLEPVTPKPIQEQESRPCWVYRSQLG